MAKGVRLKNGMASGDKRSLKNSSTKLYNHFSFCNNFLLYVLYLYLSFASESSYKKITRFAREFNGQMVACQYIRLYREVFVTLQLFNTTTIKPLSL